MRLIDADELCKACKERGSECTGNACEVPTMPTIDAVPVVRCRECEHWGGVDEYGDGYCKNPDGIDNIAKENDFCSYGERSIKK